MGGRGIIPGGRIFHVRWLIQGTGAGAALGAQSPPTTNLLPLQVPSDQRDPGLPQLPPLVGEARLRLTLPRGSARASGTAAAPLCSGPFGLRRPHLSGRGARVGGGVPSPSPLRSAGWGSARVRFSVRALTAIKGTAWPV